MLKIFSAALLGACISYSCTSAFACSACGCSFNSDWASEGYTATSGMRFDIRYDYIDQSQLRHGAHGISKNDFELPGEEEVQQYTITRETLVGFDYSPQRDWGIRLLVPFFDRTHGTVAEGDTASSFSQTEGLGDLSLVARYQGFTRNNDLGVQLGLKLPTGSFTDTFLSGPQAGERIDRGLQNGSGTTDAIAGVYYFGSVVPEAEYFMQVQVAQPFAQREEFKPGASMTISSGIGYQVLSWLRPQAQLNYRFESREIGENSDHNNSGGKFLYITPGLSLNISNDVSVYTLFQVPLFQDVHGLQLEPHVIYSAGLRVKI